MLVSDDEVPYFSNKYQSLSQSAQHSHSVFTLSHRVTELEGLLAAHQERSFSMEKQMSENESRRMDAESKAAYFHQELDQAKWFIDDLRTKQSFMENQIVTLSTELDFERSKNARLEMERDYVQHQMHSFDHLKSVLNRVDYCKQALENAKEESMQGLKQLQNGLLLGHNATFLLENLDKIYEHS
jgi:chromosome segregation ATPase